MTEFEKRPAGVLFKGEQIKKLIQENPDLPVCFLANEEANIGDYNTMFCTSCYAEIGEILDCMQEINDEIVFTDRDMFEECVSDNLSYNDDWAEASDAAFDAEVKRIIAEYEPYWKKCILITVGN